MKDFIKGVLISMGSMVAMALVVTPTVLADKAGYHWSWAVLVATIALWGGFIYWIFYRKDNR